MSGALVLGQLTPVLDELGALAVLVEAEQPDVVESGVRYVVASSWAYERFTDGTDTSGAPAFYEALFRLPEVYRVDPAPERPGPTIRIIDLGT